MSTKAGKAVSTKTEKAAAKYALVRECQTLNRFAVEARQAGDNVQARGYTIQRDMLAEAFARRYA